MAGVRAMGRRLPVLAAVLSGVLAVVLAVGAVLLAGQTAPTEPAAAARDHAVRLLEEVTAAAGLPQDGAATASGAACPWLGLAGLPASPQVRPRAEVSFPLAGGPAAALDAVARAARAAGATIDARAPSGLEARDAAGYRLTVRVDGGLRLVAEAPCVWPDGERRPG
jgi:hypothetical protein